MKNYDSTIDEIYQAINTIWQKFLYVVNSGIYEKKMDLAQLYTEKIDKQNEKSKEIQYEPQSILDLDTHWFDLNKEEIKLETPVQIGLFNKHPLQCNFDFRTRIPETSITDWLLIFVSACVILVLWYMVLNEVLTIMGYFKNI